jgi:tetratricopeptide (TPR) repeat protein
VAHPQDLHAWKELLELHIEKARFDAFLRELARVPQELRSAASLRLLEARVLRRTDQIDQAYSMLVELCREEAEPRAFYELGLLEYGRGELEAACAAFQRGAEGRWAADAHFNRAVCLERLGRYRQAAEAHEAAVRERAELREAWLQLGNLRRFRLGEADLAREAYARYLQLGGDDPEVRRWMEGAQ